MWILGTQFRPTVGAEPTELYAASINSPPNLVKFLRQFNSTAERNSPDEVRNELLWSFLKENQQHRKVIARTRGKRSPPPKSKKSSNDKFKFISLIIGIGLIAVVILLFVVIAMVVYVVL